MRDVIVRQQFGEMLLCWECPYCENFNERVLSGTPWKCMECAYIDRSVESQAADISRAQAQEVAPRE